MNDKNNWTIFGSGFGLYGYLPAISYLKNCQIFLDKKYQDVVFKRIELKKISSRIIWYVDLNDVINNIDSAVIAINPEQQPSLLNKLLEYKSISKYILEKPLAINPKLSKDILSNLINKDVRFTFGYSFLYTSWFKSLKDTLINSNEETVFLKWNFKAHHIANNKKIWKADHEKGGGPLRFYGIHIIALLSAIGYRDVILSFLESKSYNSFTKWKAIFCGDNLPIFQINININSDLQQFNIYCETQKKRIELINLRNPFEMDIIENDFDFRVKILSRIIEDEAFFENLEVYKLCNELWAKCERCLP